MVINSTDTKFILFRLMVNFMRHYGQECETSCGDGSQQYPHVCCPSPHYSYYNKACDALGTTVIINNIMHYNSAKLHQNTYLQVSYETFISLTLQ
jgi:hypothetical protein